MENQSESLEKQAVYSADLPISDKGSEELIQDDKDMARMGEKQEFKRSFDWVGSVGFTSCIMDKFIIPSLHVFDADL